MLCSFPFPNLLKTGILKNLHLKPLIGSECGQCAFTYGNVTNASNHSTVGIFSTVLGFIVFCLFVRFLLNVHTGVELSWCWTVSVPLTHHPFPVKSFTDLIIGLPKNLPGNRYLLRLPYDNSYSVLIRLPTPNFQGGRDRQEEETDIPLSS